MLRLLLLVVITLGVFTMQHVAGPDASCCPPATAAETGTVLYGDAHHASSATADEHSSHSSGHHLLHLCLAMLGAAALVLGFWLLARSRLSTALRWIRQQVTLITAPLRPPRRRHGFTLLLSLCVIRT